MLAFVAPRLVLLSVPKTGTTALESALAPLAQVALLGRPEIKHIGLARYQQQVEPLLAAIPGPRFRTIAVVREPVSWLGSWYRYRRRPELDGRPNSTAGISFDAFVTAWLAPERPPFARLAGQGRMLEPAPGGRPPDLLFRYEALPALVDFLSAALRVPLSLPVVNVSPAADLTLSLANEARLREALAEDFALWRSAAV